MSNIPTSEEFIVLYNSKPQKDSLMIAFAKLHVEAALEAAAEKADTCEQAVSRGHETVVDTDTILNSYPLENIK